jgi:AmmeMemoRadiSam system protein A
MFIDSSPLAMPGHTHHALPPKAGEILLALARGEIAKRLGTAFAGVEPREPWLDETGASFVTLTHQDKLRGCIGTLEAHRALGEDVKANAVAAAFRDPRFEPLTRIELDAITVEISVLSPLETVAFRDENDALAQLRPAVDGVIFEYGHHRSTFLPQVWEDFNDPREFLGHLKYKAGLPPDFWDMTVKLSRYTVARWREGATR